MLKFRKKSYIWSEYHDSWAWYSRALTKIFYLNWIHQKTPCTTSHIPISNWEYFIIIQITPQYSRFFRVIVKMLRKQYTPQSTYNNWTIYIFTTKHLFCLTDSYNMYNYFISDSVIHLTTRPQ